MSTLLSVFGFAVQFCVLASVGAIVISSVCPLSTDSAFISKDHPTGAVVPVDVDDSDATLPIASSYCAKSMMSTVITTTISDDVTTDDYSALTIRQLKALCRERGIKRYSNLRKHELVELLQN